MIFKAIEMAFAIIAFVGALGLGFIGIMIISWMINEVTGKGDRND